MSDPKKPEYATNMAKLAFLAQEKLEGAGFALVVFDGEQLSFVSNRPTTESMHAMRALILHHEENGIPEQTLFESVHQGKTH